MGLYLLPGRSGTKSGTDLEPENGQLIHHQNKTQMPRELLEMCDHAQQSMNRQSIKGLKDSLKRDYAKGCTERGRDGSGRFPMKLRMRCQSVQGGEGDRLRVRGHPAINKKTDEADQIPSRTHEKSQRNSIKCVGRLSPLI